jgi:hypothetical protein
VDPQHGRAEGAGEQMNSELDAIQQRLKTLKRKLDERESLYDIEQEIAGGDALSMNPLTAGTADPSAPAGDR